MSVLLLEIPFSCCVCLTTNTYRIFFIPPTLQSNCLISHSIYSIFKKKSTTITKTSSKSDKCGKLAANKANEPR